MSGNTTSLSIRYDLRYVNNPNMYLHLFLGKFKDYYKKLLQKISSLNDFKTEILKDHQKEENKACSLVPRDIFCDAMIVASLNCGCLSF